MDDLLNDFLIEANEHLEEVGELFLLLEKDPGSKETITSLFRAIHSVKGTCGMFGLTKLAEVSHKTEDVLGGMREGTIDVTPNIITILLGSVDVIKFILSYVEKHGREPEQNFDKLISILQKIFKTKKDVSKEVFEEATKEEIKETHDESKTDQSQKNNKNQTLRINIELLDDLMNRVGELVLIRNQLIEISKDHKDKKFTNAINQLNHITSNLQESFLKTRMRPIEEAWSKLPRMVRDLSNQTKKKINLKMSGESTELDRQVLQAIQDPLAHCVRNSADHGIESPEDRLMTGKTEEGTILLDAKHEGGRIIISITDDGKGVPPEIIKKKCIEKNILTEEKANQLTDEQAIQMIFEPGFSTAQEITDISGRGVGMDVVKSSITQLGGNVQVTSSLGEYTKIEFRLPLTLAIISALTVSVKTGENSSQIYAIPQLAISDLVRMSHTKENKFYKIDNALVLEKRGRIIPLISLKSKLKINNEVESFDNCPIVIFSSNDKEFGLIVDQVLETQEIVVKSLGSTFKGLNYYSGATVLGNGQVILILDPEKIYPKQNKHIDKQQNEGITNQSGKIRSFNHLLYMDTFGIQQIANLSQVNRLEEFNSRSFEKVDDYYFISYNQKLLPILNSSLSDDFLKNNDYIPTIILNHGDEFVGIVTSKILDVINEEELVTNNQFDGKTCLVQGKATSILDLEKLFEIAQKRIAA